MIMSGDNYSEIMRLVAQTETHLQKYLGINMLAYGVDTCLTQTRKIKKRCSLTTSIGCRLQSVSNRRHLSDAMV